MKKYRTNTYAVYDRDGVFVFATRSEASSIDTAHTYAKKAGTSYIRIAKPKKKGKRASVTSLKCVLRFGKNQAKKCPVRGAKKCKKMAIVWCSPTRGVPKSTRSGARKR